MADLWDALPPGVRDELETIQDQLHVDLRLRSGNDGVPYLAGIPSRCPLCVENADSKEERHDLERGTAYLLLPSLTYRCRNDLCPASGEQTGFNAKGKPNGLPFKEWKQFFRVLRDDPAKPEQTVAGGPPAAKQTVTPGNAPGTPQDEIAIRAIEASGKFFVADEIAYYVRATGGEPLRVSSKAFGAVAKKLLVGVVNGSVRAAVEGLIEHAHLHGARVQLEFVTGRTTFGEPLFHFGGGRVMKVGASGLTWVDNGTGGVLFTTEQDFAPLTNEEMRPVAGGDKTRFPALHEAILDGIPAVGGALERDEVKALLLAGWLAAFLRPWGVARPITLLVGPAGCGKTTLQRQVAVAFFGREGEVGGGAQLDRASKDLLAGAVFQSLVIRDDVSDLPPGGIDALCRMATGTKARLATFHETLGLTTYRARGSLLLSAVAPTWLTRGDLMSRIWMIELAAATETTTTTERDRIERVLALRPAIWAETMLALRVLAKPLPPRRAISRFDAYEQAAYPILEAAGYGAAFEAAIRKMPGIVAGSAARADPLLGYLLALAQQISGQWLDAAALVDALAETLGVHNREKEPHLASGVVRDPLRLAQLLGKIEREGSAVVIVRSRMSHGHRKQWSLTPKVAGGDGGVGGVDPEVTSSRREEEEIEGDEDAQNTPPTPPLPPPAEVH